MTVLGTGTSWRLLKVLLSGSLIKALLYVLQSFPAPLPQCKVNWFLDSQNTCRIVSVGTSKPELQAIAIEIFEVCMSFDIAMEIEWLPRS